MWAILIPLSIIPFYSISEISLQSSIYGCRQQIPASYIQYIRNNSRENEMPPVISAWQTRKQPWAMLNYRTGGYLNPIQSSSYPSSLADYIIIEKEMLDSIDPGYKTALQDSQTNTILFSKISKTKEDIIKTIQLTDITDDKNNYKELSTFFLQEDTIKNLLIGMDCWWKASLYPWKRQLSLKYLIFRGKI